jgi:hypothetical protein
MEIYKPLNQLNEEDKDEQYYAVLNGTDTAFKYKGL